MSNYYGQSKLFYMRKIITYFIVTVLIINVEKVWAQTSTTIYTPNCSVVSDTYICPELTSAQIAANNNYVETYYPNATRLSNASGTYNCHGYAWYMTQGGSNVWIGYFTTTAEDVFWTDGSYYEVSTQSGNSKVSYTSDNHSAVTTDVTDIFQSKWGSLPLMRHNKNYCPYNSTTLKYYKLSYAISGDNTVCTTSNDYTITNLPTGATVTWTATPSGIATINSPSSTQTTLTKNNNGSITLTATIANVCGGNIVINKKIVVGYTQILNISYPSSTVAPDELIPMQIFVAPDSFVIGNQKLVIKRMGGGYTDSIYTGGDGAVEFSFPTTGTYNIKVYTYNDCGWSTSFYPLVFFCTNDEMFMLSPNPAHTSLTVKLSDETVQSENVKSKGTGIKEIQLTDKMGNVLKRYVYSGTDKQVTIDVSALKADIYYIKLFNGKQWKGKSFIKQ